MESAQLVVQQTGARLLETSSGSFHHTPKRYTEGIKSTGIDHIVAPTV
jgi:hypothetical protein